MTLGLCVCNFLFAQEDFAFTEFSLSQDIAKLTKRPQSRKSRHRGTHSFQISYEFGCVFVQKIELRYIPAHP